MDQQQMIGLCGMEESLRRLIGLYCMPRPSEKEIADWFSGVEFEALRPEASCMAAAMAAANDYAGVPAETIPRLRGIVKYVHTLNSGMTAGLCALGQKLGQAGIVAEVLGSTAVHLGYEKPLRHIWQMEIGVTETDFPRIGQLAAQAGFALEQTPYSITARSGNTQCILIRKGMSPGQNASTLTVGGASFLMEGSADLLVSLAQAIFQLLWGPAPGAKLLPLFMDLHRVISSGPDWAEAAAAAAEHGVADHVRLVLELYNSLAPDILTEDITNLFGTEPTAARLAQLLVQYRDIRPGYAGLKKRWLSARIRSGDTPADTWKLFLGELLRSAAKRLIPGS